VVGLSIARGLERLGLAEAAEAARRVRWFVDHLRWSLRPARAARLTMLWLREHAGRSAYVVLTEEAIRATRRSETVFLFGSGKSILEIGDAEWDYLGRHDTIAFSHFHRHRGVRVDYHLVAELFDLEGTASSIASNPFYAETVFLVMKGWLAERGNEMVARRLLPPGARIFRFKRRARGRIVPPSPSLSHGLVHGSNSSLDVTNFALAMGWRRIVLVGIDLYDKEYFYLPPGVTGPGEPPGVTATSRFPGAEQTVATLALWRELAGHDGVELFVYNPRSLLAEVLPVFIPPTA
jgi:hypothetical protein